MTDETFVDYYELLQISPNAELETINRVYKMLAARYHPDHPETGDVDRFVLLNQAYEILGNSERRQDYNMAYAVHHAQPIDLFDTKDFAMGVDGKANRRMGILCLLYNRRRSNTDHPGLSILEFETMMSFPREHLMFTMWYLKDRDFIRQDDKSDYVITGVGVDYVETHLPDHKVLYKLLKAPESTRTSAMEG